MNFSLFTKTVLAGFRYFAYFFGIFFLSRLIFLAVYGNENLFKDYKIDIFNAFIMGARFDVSAICYGFLPIALCWLIALFIRPAFCEKFEKIYLLFSKYYLLFVLIVFISLHIIDFFFYQFFQSHINVLFFGIFNDDTSAVLHSVWTDYPIVKVILLYVAGIIGFLYIHRGVRHYFQQRTPLSKSFGISLLLIFPLFVVGMRGSIGEFTLRRDHTNIGTNAFVNSLCYNPVYALNFAKTELNENYIVPNISNELQTKGFSSFEEVQNQYKQQAVDTFDMELFSQTPTNNFLKQNPPNVIFVLMESMSNHYFELHSPELNLLGDLATLLPDLYYFKNGLSSFNGTIASLENLLVNSPKGIISQSPYFNVSYTASVAKPFKEQGYETSFVTGANPSWRNVDNFIKHQGFSSVEGSAHIKKQNPKAEEFAWGVHDGYLFDYITHKLQHSSGKPQFIFSLTVSNHTPYEIPSHYKPYPIEIETVKKDIRVTEQMAYENFYSHQYAASQLAKFIRDIKDSPLGKNTIIVATGDHNIRQVFEYDDTNAFLKRSVPILFYIPETYAPTFFNPNIFVSHKDIFPTLFHLSLSAQKYVYSGDNMFQKSPNHRFAIHNYNFIADSVGVFSTDNNHLIYSTWQDSLKRKLTPNDLNSAHAQWLQRKMKTFETMQTLRTYIDIDENHSKN